VIKTAGGLSKTQCDPVRVLDDSSTILALKIILNLKVKTPRSLRHAFEHEASDKRQTSRATFIIVCLLFHTNVPASKHAHTAGAFSFGAILKRGEVYISVYVSQKFCGKIRNDEIFHIFQIGLVENSYHTDVISVIDNN
jgi:hypothetical protein